jgi:phage terminase large subunit-like protein
MAEARLALASELGLMTPPEKMPIDAFALKYLGLQMEPFMVEWANFILDETKHYKVLLAPFGHAKSTVSGLIVPLYLICYNRDIRILLTSKSPTLAKKTLRRLAIQLESNPLLIRDFGVFFDKDNKWTESLLEVIRPGKGLIREATLEAVGRMGTIEGGRFDVEIADDPIDMEAVRSPADRQQTEQWAFETVYGRLEPQGNCTWVGTRWAMEDIYGVLINTPDHFVLIYKAIQPDGKTVLWPARWPLEVLLSRRKLRVRTFEMHYQNEATPLEGTMFKREWFRYFHDASEIPGIGRMEIFGGVDPAGGENKDSDSFAYSVVAIDRHAKLPPFAYVLESRGAIIPLKEQHEWIRSFNRLYRPQRIAVESNGLQFLAYESLLAEGIPLVRQTAGGQDKLTRIERLAVPTENGSMAWNAILCVDCVEQMIGLPMTSHDDIADSAEIACRAGGFPFKSDEESWEPGMPIGVKTFTVG